MGIAQIPAVTGPTLAEITTAITTNAAPASVTNSSIATQVANNSVSPNNWTLITTASPGYSANTVTLSGLSGYRVYRIIFVGMNLSGTNGSNLNMRLNGDTANNYSFRYAQTIGGTSLQNIASRQTNGIQMNGADGASGAWNGTDITIEQASMTNSIKTVRFISSGYLTSNGQTSISLEGLGFWKSTSAVSSITLYHPGTSTLGAETIYVLGGN